MLIPKQTWRWRRETHRTGPRLYCKARECAKGTAQHGPAGFPSLRQASSSQMPSSVLPRAAVWAESPLVIGNAWRNSSGSKAVFTQLGEMERVPKRTRISISTMGESTSMDGIPPTELEKLTRYSKGLILHTIMTLHVMPVLQKSHTVIPFSICQSFSSFGI